MNSFTIYAHVTYSSQYDLVSPDGIITQFERIDERKAKISLKIQSIPPSFVGFDIPKEQVVFNLKSTVAQLGLDGTANEVILDKKNQTAEISLDLIAYGPIAKKFLEHLSIGAHIGKLFAADDRRRVRDPLYLSRMFGRSDRWGDPLLSLGGLEGSRDLILEKVAGRTIAYLSLLPGRVVYDETIYGFLPTIVRALCDRLPIREMLSLHQHLDKDLPRTVGEDEILLVRTPPLHVRTAFARVVNPLVAKGYQHTTANILQPDTLASGDIYEFIGKSEKELTDIPLEFYTLEPYREHVFFADRDQLQTCLEEETAIFQAFGTAPTPIEMRVATYVVKGEQLLQLSEKDWVARKPMLQEFPGQQQGTRQALMVERYIEQQPSYPFLKNIDDDVITSQGILLTRYFPSPLMKRMLLSNQVQRCLKGIYFQYPSLSHEEFFSAEDRALLHDLEKFAIPVFWTDPLSQRILRYVQKKEADSGLFVPLKEVEKFLLSTVFGIYGSNLISGHFDTLLNELLEGILALREEVHHPLLHPNKPLALVTGGGPGAMEVGNRVAKQLGILSCANILDFRLKDESVVNEQLQNPYIEAKMTYRLDKLVERQAEFNLDFPIFLPGGIGTDFEFSLEEVRQKVGSTPPHPILLLGPREHWERKISSRFQCNRDAGTTKGSEWLSNCFFSIQTAAEGVAIYRQFFENRLPIGPQGPVYDAGFVVATSE